MNWWLFSLCFLFLLITFLFSSLSIYFSSFSYGYGYDLVSFWLIFLTIWIVFLIILASYKVKLGLFKREFLLVVLLLLIFLIISFSCSNLFIFYLWFESRIIPTLFLIFGWGYQPERLLAGLYLIFYTLFASIPLLIGIFYIYLEVGSLYYFLIRLEINIYLYLSIVLAFLIKIPIFFTHFWLPKAHVEAPVSGSIILAGVLLKLGGYGLYRVLIFINNYIYYNYIFIILRLYGSVIVGLLCLCQVDIKSIIAYSSVSHIGLVLGGLITNNYYGLWGSLVIIIGHGLCSSGLFALANLIYERTNSRRIFINKGFLLFIPSMRLFWFLLIINNISSPPSLNLLGELLLIIRLVSWSSRTMIYLVLSSLLCCGYRIYLYSITQHGIIYSGLLYKSYSNIRENLLIIFHWLPLNLFFLKADLVTLWI